MIVTVGGISVDIAAVNGTMGQPTADVRLGPDDPLFRFTGRGTKGPVIDLAVTWVGETSWDGILTSRDFARIRRIARMLDKRFPFTRVSWEGAVGLTAPATDGDLSLPLLAEFDEADVSVVPHPGFLLAVDHRTGRAEALVKVTPGLESPLTTVLQAVLALIAPDHGALMLHAASLVLSGGYLFVGSSGAGKSTIAGSVNPGAVLSDDGSWCKYTDGRFLLYPTPFSQVSAASKPGGPAPLRHILFLEQGNGNRTIDLSPGRAMTMLLLNHIHFFRFMGRRAARKAFALAGEICAGHPVSTLVFTLDFDPVPFFRGISNERKKAV